MENIMQYITAGNIIFFILAAATLLFGILTVTSTRILRAATYLFFTLFSIAGLYLQMSYDFLAAVQLSVYAGGGTCHRRIGNLRHHVVDVLALGAGRREDRRVGDRRTVVAHHAARKRRGEDEDRH